MITYKITFKKANYEEIKQLVKVFKVKARHYFTDLAGKDLCFSFASEKEKFRFIEDFKISLETKSTRDYAIYATYAVIYLRK